MSGDNHNQADPPHAREDTYGGLVIDPARCAYCAAWPESPCALHHRDETRWDASR